MPHEPLRLDGQPGLICRVLIILWMIVAPYSLAFAQAPPVLPPAALAPLTPPVPRVLPPEQPQIVPPAPAPQLAPPPTGAPVRVDQIRFEGVTVYDQAMLDAFAAGAVGPAVPRSTLDDVAQRLQARYRDDGYILTLVRGEFQRSGDQVVFVIRAIEGYIKDVKLDGDIGAAGTLVYDMLSRLTRGRPTNNSDLERYLLLANDIPGVTVRAVLRREGSEPGAVELVAQVSRRELNGQLNFDNRGPPQAGPYEILLSGATNSFTSFGERVEALIFNTFNREQIFGQVNASTFLGSDGLRLRTYFGRGNTQPGGNLAPINFNGDLTIGGGEIVYPAIRSRRTNLFINSDIDVYRTTITLGNPVTSTQFSDLLIYRFGAYADYQDAWLFDLAAANSLNVKVSRGLGGNSNTRPGNVVQFTKVGGDLTRVQDFGTIEGVRPALKLSVGGQWTDNVLPPSEKFFLGGTRFGRGYFNGEATGDRAIGSTVELQVNTSFSNLPLVSPEYRLPAQFYFFWDYGRPFNAPPATDIVHTLNSVGIGVRSDLTSWLFAEVEGVHRLTVFPQGAAATHEHPYAVFTRITMHY